MDSLPADHAKDDLLQRHASESSTKKPANLEDSLLPRIGPSFGLELCQIAFLVDRFSVVVQACIF
jgi:hypothetical protein